MAKRNPTSFPCQTQVDAQLNAAIEQYVKNIAVTRSVCVRFALIEFLKNRGFLPKNYKNSVINGGDRWTAKLQDPATASDAQAQLSAQAAIARAARKK